MRSEVAVEATTVRSSEFSWASEIVWDSYLISSTFEVSLSLIFVGKGSS